MTARIRELRTHRVRVPLLRTFTTAVRSAEAVIAVIVEALDTEGNSGWGEATANWQVTGESLAGIEAAVAGPLRDAVIGQRPGDVIESNAVEESIFSNTCARSAVDCAVFDLVARQNGRSLVSELWRRGPMPSPIPATTTTTDMTISAGPADEVLAQARAHANFSTIKVKVDANPDHIAAVAAVRAELGSEVRLRVDANQAWDAETATTIIRGWEEAGVNIEFVEQPTPARDLRALATVARHVDTPILADESVWNLADLRLLETFTTDVALNVKLAKTGGRGPALNLIHAATELGFEVVVGCMMESPVGLAAALAAATSIPPSRVHDLDAGLWQPGGLVNGGITYSADTIRLDPAPGTGITSVAVQPR